MTEKSTIVGTGIEGFEQVLERFGSDRTRWPAPVRRDFAGLLATSAEAQARVREAEALDRLLDLAPQPAIDTRALADRIMAAVEKEAPAVSPPAARIVWARRTAAVEAQWPAAALLAASLVLGGVFGLSGTFNSAVAPLMVAEASAADDIDTGRIALDNDAADFFEEDLL